MPKKPLRKPTIMRRTKDAVHDAQRLIGSLKKGASAGMRTDLKVGEKPVIFIHNPRTGGRSLEGLFNVKRLSHRYPSEKLTEDQWLASYVVSAVRHPLDRFFSHYIGLVKDKKKNRLVKLYGEGIYDLTAMEYLELIKTDPQYSGSQTQWTDFPSATKPRADLVLRFEDIGHWLSILKDAGVPVEGRAFKHIGKSIPADGSREKTLGMSKNEMIEVCAAVEEHYAKDYETFDYARTGVQL